MKLNIIVAFFCINFAMGMQNFPGSPIYAGDADNCFYRSSTAPALDPVQGRIPSQLELNNLTDVQNELVYPRNATLVNGSTLIGSFTDGLDSIRESGEQFWKSLEVFKHIVKSNYAADVLGNFAINCQLAPNGTYIMVDADPDKPGINSSPLWVYFIDGVKALFVLLTAFVLFYIITGKSFSLTS